MQDALAHGQPAAAPAPSAVFGSWRRPSCERLDIVDSMPRSLLLVTALAAALATGLAACGGDDDAATTPPPPSPTTATTAGAATATSTQLSAPRAATKNTTRIDAADAAAVAATTALTMYPATAEDTRPRAVVLAGADDWRSILLASSFAAPPLSFPLLLMDGRQMPPVTTTALSLLQPTGSPQMNRAQGLRINVSTRQESLRTRNVTASTPAGLSRATDRQLTRARGKASSRVLVVNGDDPTIAAPAAAWAARSGDPILFVGSGTLPADTRAALESHENPRIYVLGGPETISRFVIDQLQQLGTVKRIAPDEAGFTPADLAIEFAKYSDLDMGFNYRNPGHGYVFAATKEPVMAMAAAGLSSGGQYGALLYVDDPGHVSPALRKYLLGVQPGFTDQIPPTMGVYNRGWLIGSPASIEVPTQGRIDALLEIQRSNDPAAVAAASGTSTEGNTQ